MAWIYERTEEMEALAERMELEVKKIQTSGAEISNAGYLYLLMNPSMPGLIKIGKTTRLTDERVKELGSSTGVPTPFALVFELWVEDCHRAEKYVHDQLGASRIARNREFFKVASTAAIKVMMDAEVFVRPEFPAIEDR